MSCLESSTLQWKLCSVCANAVLILECHRNNHVILDTWIPLTVLWENVCLNTSNTCRIRQHISMCSPAGHISLSQLRSLHLVKYASPFSVCWEPSCLVSGTVASHNFYMHWETKKLGGSRYCNIHFIVMVWNQTQNLSEVNILFMKLCQSASGKADLKHSLNWSWLMHT